MSKFIDIDIDVDETFSTRVSVHSLARKLDIEFLLHLLKEKGYDGKTDPLDFVINDLDLNIIQADKLKEFIKSLKK